MQKHKRKNNKHYRHGNIECIDGIRAALGRKGFIEYCRGNVLKYIWRFPWKGKLEDLYKAQDYLTWLIKEMEHK